MSENLLKNPDECYRLAERRAVQYFQSLSEQVSQKNYISTLIKDIQAWKSNHIHHHSLLSFFPGKKGKTRPQGYHNYLKWLDYTGKLESYLDRSISYIYMRDLGKSLESPDTLARIQHVVEGLKRDLIYPASTDVEDQTDLLSKSWMYRKAQKEGIESTFFWLMGKLKTFVSNIPKEMDGEQAQRKLIKIIGGVIMHVIEEMDDSISHEERSLRLDEAIRLGYSYGLTYPFIDDLLDSKVLSPNEKGQFSDLIRNTLITGNVPKMGEWSGDNKDLMYFIYSELREAFQYIHSHQRRETRRDFYEQAFVFFHSQEVDRNKDLSNANYTNEELFIPIILKSSSSRLIVRSLISAPLDEGFDIQTFYYGIYNQLADDFADMSDDLKIGAVTPYTYYLKYHNQRSNLINPFELYWAVITNLIHNVYHSDAKTCEVILDRAINGLKRFKERMGKKKYGEVMGLFASGIPELNKVIQKMVQKADDVDFFDKLLRDHMITTLKNERKEREDFKKTIEDARVQINSSLQIPHKDDPLLNDPLIAAANYSLVGDGKRLRPIMTWVLGVKEYGLNHSTIGPLLKAIEYMHTASLIFDDLPSQDNASIRRGRPTLHQVYNTAIAELTGLFLTQKATEELASLEQFDAISVLKLIHYSAGRTADMCIGQAMDLDSKGKTLTLEQLNRMSFYKTGIAFEASLIMPSILAQVSEIELKTLKKFALHAGIAFQIKDDLLDVEGEIGLLGKAIGKDAENNNTTFVSILGSEGAKKAMWEHYCLALEALQEMPRDIVFLKHLLNYFINRDH
ncbi:polyprenyl synthetase family protein [Bacillus massilinigeriensis]|uniref:polyprenyl synthetase family protein n=1 Tax=Bacillus massilionigeriensis TaxID=1805475 RepID=UPI00096B0E04|nr:polyprenyl synthetase family protein [Bacillus massilionigeriensis]